LSHFTTVATQVNDLVCLAEALDDTEMEYSREDLTVRGWRGNKETADMVIRTGGSYDIGVRRLKNGFYEFVADWWGVETSTGKTQEEVLHPLLQRYAYRKVSKEIKAKGYQIAREQKTEKQELKLTVRRWKA
jgi:hypothetical protein